MPKTLLALAAALLAVPCAAQPGSGQPPIGLLVDATQAPRRIFHSTMTIPVHPGPLTLAYPQWIPGEHSASGPIADVAGLQITAAGKPLPWRRDLVEAWNIHCDVPQGVDSIQVQLDYLSPTTTEGFTDGPSSTPQLAIIDWHLMLVYPYPFDNARPAPANYTDTVQVAAELRMPEGWKCGSSLVTTSVSPDGPRAFAPVSLTHLVDHPVLIGAHFRSIDLAPGASPEHRMDIAADSEAALAIGDDRIANYRRLITETAALMDARRYTRYHFLVSLSDHLSHFGLEHHECSDDRTTEKFLIDADEHRDEGALLSHEYFHSWNGKFRRPAGLATPDYQQPMRGDLLWVYEGLTEYYGDVLAVRCGNWSPEEYREYLARVAANLDHTSGRAWRPLRDTCDAASFLYSAAGSWGNWRRGTDFYDEGELIWLEADTLIREKTAGKKSLDDFCRAFHGAGFRGGSLAGEAPTVASYTYEDVVTALNGVCPYDWAAFFHDRLDRTSAEAPKGGLAAAGYKLAYNDTPNTFGRGAGDFVYTLGVSVKDTGEIDNLVRGLPAERAGLAPGMRIIAVGRRKFTPELLREAVKASRSVKDPIELLVENADFYTAIRIDYHDGLRYPHLERTSQGPDLLEAIITPLANDAQK